MLLFISGWNAAVGIWNLSEGDYAMAITLFLISIIGVFLAE